MVDKETEKRLKTLEKDNIDLKKMVLTLKQQIKQLQTGYQRVANEAKRANAGVSQLTDVVKRKG